MSLRRKTLLTLGLTLFILIAVVSILLSFIIRENYQQLETELVQRSIQQASNAFERELRGLEVIVADWAPWDATRDFVQGTNDTYAEENLVDATFLTLRLNFMLFFDKDDALIYQGGFDLQAEQQVPVPSTVLQRIREHFHLLYHPDARSGQVGIVALPDQAVLLAAYPISSSTYGPVMGTMIIGRYLSVDEVALLSEQTALDIGLYRWDDPDLPADVQAVQTSLIDAPDVVQPLPDVVQPLDEDTVAGYALLADMHNQPALILRVVLPRTIYTQGLLTQTTMLGILLISGGVFVGLALLVMEYMVLARLNRLSTDVTQIDEQRNLSLRLNSYGTDELGRLATTINQMLTNLDDGQAMQRRISLEVQQSRDLLRTIFDTIEDGLVLLDSQGTVLSANSAIAALFGKQPADLYHMSWQKLCRSQVHCCAKGSATAFPCLWVLDTLHDGEVCQQRIRVLCESGSTRVFDVRALPIGATPAHNGQTDSGYREHPLVVVHTIDVSEQIQMEALIAENERFTASQRITQIIAHEINSPLQTILSSLEVINDIDDTQQLQFLDTARREIERVGTIVHKLRDLYQEQQQQATAVEIQSVLERILLLVRGDLTRQNIALHGGIAPDLPPVYGRGDQLMQVFLNLVLNAIDAMPEGGDLCVEATSDPDSQSVNVHIRDTGIGIATNAYQRIFDPFYTTKAHGTGLGLAVCHQIVADHNGTIEVQSTPKQGSSFTVRLPVFIPAQGAVL